MKNKSVSLRVIAGVLLIAVLWSSCTSSTLIQTEPPGAKAYVNGQPIGTTPCVYRDNRIIFSTNQLRLEKEGYESVNTSFSRDEDVEVGAIVAGVFIWFPLLWALKYNPFHQYVLNPVRPQVSQEKKASVQATPINDGQKSKTERLRELKQLLDEKILTQEEFDKEKKKILDEVEK